MCVFMFVRRGCDRSLPDYLKPQLHKHRELFNYYRNKKGKHPSYREQLAKFDSTRTSNGNIEFQWQTFWAKFLQEDFDESWETKCKIMMKRFQKVASNVAAFSALEIEYKRKREDEQLFLSRKIKKERKKAEKHRVRSRERKKKHRERKHRRRKSHHHEEAASDVSLEVVTIVSDGEDSDNMDIDKFIKKAKNRKDLHQQTLKMPKVQSSVLSFNLSPQDSNSNESLNSSEIADRKPSITEIEDVEPIDQPTLSDILSPETDGPYSLLNKSLDMLLAVSDVSTNSPRPFSPPINAYTSPKTLKDLNISPKTLNDLNTSPKTQKDLNTSPKSLKDDIEPQDMELAMTSFNDFDDAEGMDEDFDGRVDKLFDDPEFLGDLDILGDEVCNILENDDEEHSEPKLYEVPEELEMKMPDKLHLESPEKTLSKNDKLDKDRDKISVASFNSTGSYYTEILRILRTISSYFGSLSSTIYELHDQAVQNFQSSSEPPKISIDDRKSLNEVADKLQLILEECAPSDEEKCTFEFILRELHSFLDLTSRPVPTPFFMGINIQSIARTTVGGEPTAVVSLIRNTLLFNGYPNVDTTDIKKIYMAVKNAQLKLIE